MHRRDVDIDNLIRVYNDLEFQSQIQSFIVAIRGLDQEKDYDDLLLDSIKNIYSKLPYDEVNFDYEDTKSEYHCCLVAACDLKRLEKI